MIGVERVEGSNWADLLKGNDDANSFKGNAGADTIDGGGGNDGVSYTHPRIAEYAGIIVDLGGTSALLSATNGAFKPTALMASTGSTGWALDATGDIDLLKNIENIEGSDWDDLLIGSNTNNQLDGRGGADTIDGAGGIDWVEYDNAEGAVRVDLSLGVAENDGSGFKDTLVSIENVLGSIHNDYIKGDNNDNVLLGRGGQDTLIGAGGNDTFAFDYVTDVFYAPTRETALVTDFNDGDKLKFDAPVNLRTGSAAVKTQLRKGDISIESTANGSIVHLGRNDSMGSDLSVELPGVNAGRLMLSTDRSELYFSPAVKPAFSVTALTPQVFEGGVANFAVNLTGDLTASTTLYFSTSAEKDGDQLADFSPIFNRAITFTPTGSRSQTISVSVEFDQTTEAVESFTGFLRETPSASGAPTPLSESAPVSITDIASADRSMVFLPRTGYVTVGSPQVRTYGSSGDDAVIISQGVTEVVLDQTVERIYLPERSTAYKVLRSGNQLSVTTFDGATTILKTPLQSDADGTEFVFNGDFLNATSRAAVFARFDKGVMTLGGVAVQDTAAAITFTAATVPTRPVPTGPVNAMAFIAENTGYTAASSGLQVFGKNGPETLIIPNATASNVITGVIADQLVDNFKFNLPSSNYSFMQLGNQLNVYPLGATASSSPILNLTVQGDNDGSQLLFGSTSHSARLFTGGVMKIGDKTIATDRPTPIDMTTLVNVSTSGSYNAGSSDSRFQMASGAYEYTISGFNSGDTLLFPIGSAPSLFNEDYKDGKVTLEWGFGGLTVRLNFDGLFTQDKDLNSFNDFNLVFGNQTASIATPALTSTTISRAGSAAESILTNNTFTVAPVTSSFNYTINGFGAGDKIINPTGVTPSVINTAIGNAADGSVVLQYVSGVNTVRVTLTGLSAADDALLTSLAGFNTVFGAGTI